MPDKKTEIINTVLNEMSDASLTDLLMFLTPEGLAADSGFSAATVRYQFRAGQGKSKAPSLAFDRHRLGLELIDCVLGRIRTTVQQNAVVYENVARLIGGVSDLEQILIAIIGDLDSYAPSAADAVDPSAQERTFLLALACCDREPDVALRLREQRSANTSRYVGVYEAFLARTSRQMVSHTSIAELAELVSMLLEGASQRRRYDPDVDLTVVARAVIRIFWAFTVLEGEQERAWEEELLAGVSTGAS